MGAMSRGLESWRELFRPGWRVQPPGCHKGNFVKVERETRSTERRMRQLESENAELKETVNEFKILVQRPNEKLNAN